ncbi:MAG TPA: histidine kinase, partial [Blastocatellia bacterium]|nr:histidine kinase [Blastocatellia bacterium]
MYNLPSINKTPGNSNSGAGFLDDHLIAAIRLILALSALLISDYPAGSPRHSDVTSLVLVSYVAYCVFLYIRDVRRPHQRALPAWAYWVDIGWYTILMITSGGINSGFFFGFLFAILVASFAWGFAAGLLATVVSALLFVATTLATRPEGSDFHTRRSLTRLLYLVVLGFLMAYWGGSKMTLNRRLKLLKEITNLPPHRLDVDRLLGKALQYLRAFYDADACLHIMAEPGTPGHRLRKVERDDPAAATTAEPVPPELLQILLQIPPERAAVYGSGLLWRLSTSRRVYDVEKREFVKEKGGSFKAIAALLDARSFVTVPLRRHHEIIGRLYLTSRRPRAFSPSDVDFLLQITMNLMSLTNHVWLVEQLAAEAAEEERQKIARDIHDSVIQPYVGLHMGLVGMRRKLSVEESAVSEDAHSLRDVISNVASDTDRLIEITDEEVRSLRGYVRELKTGGRESDLLAAVRRFG